jgi:NTE family protein
MSTQNVWNPSRIFESNKTLRLKDFEIAQIRPNLPQADDGNYYVDAVFEGGGVKGTAFLGALRCFADVGIRFRKVAGTSAGAITAAVLAAGFSIDEMEQGILGPLDYEGQLLREKTSWLIQNGSPSDDLANFQWLLARLVAAGQEGQYRSEPFKRWLKGHLQSKLTTFAPFAENRQAHLPWYQKRDLRVVVSDISNREMRVLPGDLHHYGESADSFEVAEAVRLSMSIPLFFEPGKLGNATIVDGGILSNFPLWIYDAELGQRPNCPTFGFRLQEKQEAAAEPVKGAFGILKAMIETMQVARDSHHTRQNDLGRIIDIKIDNIPATKFDLTNEEKDKLYEDGYKAAKAFLQQWSWNEHLAKRGFAPATASAFSPEVVAV